MWYIIRHGETSHNAKKIQQGHYPSNLNMNGIEQTKAMANKLLKTEKNIKNFKFISSPMLRTRKTIEIIMHILGIKEEAEHDDLLSSRCKGIFENRSKDFIKKNFPEEIKKKEEDKWNYTPPHGESSESMYQRLKKFIKKHRATDNLVIVLHNNGSGILREMLKGKNKKQIKKERKRHNQGDIYCWDGAKIKKINGKL